VLGGESIKEMQNITGCKINVSQPAGRDIEREIGLVGTRHAVEMAKRAIMDKVDAVVSQEHKPEHRKLILTRLTRIQETVHKAETTDLMIPMAAVDTHILSSSRTLRVVLALNNLLHPVLVEKTHMPHMEATTTTWRCGTQQWPNNSNRVQVSKPDHQVLDDERRALLDS
jgi:KH domain